MRRLVSMMLVGALTAAVPAAAQDFSMPGTSPMDLAPQSQALTSSVIGNLSVGDTARRSGGGGGRYAAAPVSRGAAFSPGRVSDAAFSYTSTPSTRKQALDAYIGRAQRKNPKATAVLAPELRQRNVESEWRGMVGPYGLRSTDAADVMTAFLMVGWEIMTGGDPTPAQVRGVRRQVAGQLATVPQMRNPALRTQFAEELKITTFVLGAGAKSAMRDGNLAQYRRGISSFYRAQTGENIAAWRLTPAGFQR